MYKNKKIGLEAEQYFQGNGIFYNLRVDLNLTLIDILKLGGESNVREIYHRRSS